jgi:hypothetical protein
MEKLCFFNSWVRVGILSIGKLRIINGRLDINHIINIVKDYRNYYSEINILQSALRKANITGSFEPILDNAIPCYTCHSEQFYELKDRGAKYYYLNIIEGIKEKPTAEHFWRMHMGISEDDIRFAYNSKIKVIKDKKLAETYFKILNNILPCNKHLYKWGKCDSKLHYFCNEEESISQILYECNYARQIWKIVKHVFLKDNDITLDMVLFGKGLSIALNYIFSIIVYYKNLLYVLNQEKRNRSEFYIVSLNHYLTIKKSIYQHCKSKILE